MTLVKARAAIEDAIEDAVLNDHPRLNILYDNVPLDDTAPNQEFLMVSIDFEQATLQPQGDAVTYYEATITCGIYVPFNQGSARTSALAESLITGLTNVNKSTYVDTHKVSPKVREIAGPTSVRKDDKETHYIGVVSCTFTANG
tara:strand:+ start:987 stop:1418 length:432 start_codon:yes stop_codon:yes gene_type:complete